MWFLEDVSRVAAVVRLQYRSTRLDRGERLALTLGPPVTAPSPRRSCLRLASELPISICHSRQAPNATKVTRK